PEAMSTERFREGIDFGAGATEDECQRWCFEIEYATERRNLVGPPDEIADLSHLRRRSGARFFLGDANPHRVAEMPFRNHRDAESRCSKGNANAAVFPVPVAAWPRRSRPSSSGGIASA